MAPYLRSHFRDVPHAPARVHPALAVLAVVPVVAFEALLAQVLLQAVLGSVGRG